MYNCARERRSDMRPTKNDASTKNSISKRLYGIGTVITRLYDRSITASVAKAVRHRFLTLSTRAIGVFLITFGLYASLVAAILRFFTDLPSDSFALFGGIVCAVCAVPLLFSAGNVSTILSESSVGSLICKLLSVNRDHLKKTDFSGQLSIAFIAGVVFGGATLMFPFASILYAMAIALMVGIILCSPEAGVTFMAISLFFADIRFQYIIIGATVISYLFKLIRGKRTVSLCKTDVFLAIFALATLGAILITRTDTATDGAFSNLFLIIPYLMAVFLLRDARKIIKLLFAVTVSAGALCAVFVLGFALASLIPADAVGDREYLIRAVSSMYAFESGFAPLAVTSLIPVCTSFIIKPKNEGKRISLILCLAAMVSYLLISEELAFVIAAVAVTAVLLLITGSRWIYLSVATALTVTVSMFFAGSFGDRLYNYIYRHLYEAYHRAETLYSFTDRQSISTEQLLCGNGFSDCAVGSSFYHSLISKLGLAGTIVFGVFLIFVIAEAIKLLLRTYRSSKNANALDRFFAAGNTAEVRMSIIATLCSLISLLICASFFDFYSSPLSYQLLFLLTGICSAYSRSTVRETEKAAELEKAKNSKERAQILISRQYN